MGRAVRPSPALTVDPFTLIDTVAITEKSVRIELSSTRLSLAIGVAHASSAEPGSEGESKLTIEVDAQPLRCGKQIKLVLGSVESTEARPDPDLIHLIGKANHWFEELKSGQCRSIADLAHCHDEHVPEVSRSISLAFLAPDIVDMIIKGHQPPSLTIERLRACRPLPLSWDEQRALLFG